MELKTKRYTAAEFDEFTLLPENVERNFELIGGEIVEKMVSNGYSSELAVNLSFYIKLYLFQNKRGGHVTGADGGYTVAGERYMPDVAYISAERQSELPYAGGYMPLAPDLAVEVVSPTDEPRPLNAKISNYLADHVVVWVIYPPDKIVHIHVPGQPVQSLNIEDTIDGGAVLPGLLLPVKDIFPVESEES